MTVTVNASIEKVWTVLTESITEEPGRQTHRVPEITAIFTVT